ncbi:bifunctional amine oxidase [Ceratobasidium theobromae]|uniref:Bifunctional amine oxidase n=1 Tax=Ceratobasidium theobromae TaxID=1582974 RepID=A0A5N5QG91_9AGAM|nr:bifunctional amine oxidase [Ceratobasidium theobromae]
MAETDLKLKNFELKVFHQYAEIILKRYHEHAHATLPLPPTGEPLPPLNLGAGAKYVDGLPITRVAIVGAGVAGLRAAMTLGDWFKVDVYDAADDDRIGGRLYTHKFSGGGQYDYFDVGAMRFPDTSVMNKTFELFDELQIPLGQYNISSPETYLLFNNIRLKRGEIDWTTDPFRVGEAYGGVIPDEYARQDPSQLMGIELQLFVDKLVANREAGLRYLLRFDHFSTRSYLATRGFPPAVINYLETMTMGTGWFDRAFTETVLEELAFKYNGQPIDWKLVVGGSSEIITKMRESLNNNENVSIFPQHRVTAVKYDPLLDTLTPLTVSGVRQTFGGFEEFQELYSHVLFTIPPPCLLPIDLSTCQMDLLQRDAIRQVSIGSSSKIGMRFKSAWWSDGQHGLNINGGQSSTDRMVRTVVYPSYGGGQSKTLIASYVWTQDSTTLGSMMGPSEDAQRMLKQVVLADLAAVHDLPLEFLQNDLEEIYPYDWSNHINSMGAFGVFGPSQFNEFYLALTRPCAGGTVYFAGEAISMIHGWVAGALESADRAVLEILWSPELSSEEREAKYQEFQDRFHPDLGVDDRDLLIKQIALSQELQFIEFGAPLRCHHKQSPVIRISIS